MTGLVGFGAVWNPWADASRGETAQILFSLMSIVRAPGASTSTTGGSGDIGAQALGVDAPITFRLFPPDNAWNTDISNYPVHPLSASYVASIGADTGLHPDFGTVWDGAPNAIPYVVVPGNQPRVPITFYYRD